MKLAHLSDLHLTEHGLDEQAEILTRCAEQIEEHECDAVLLTGDFYGHTVPHRSSPKERAVLFAFVARLASARPVVVLYGNHDYPQDLDPLSELGGELGWQVKVVSTAESFDLFTPAGPLLVLALAYPNKRWLLADKPAMGAENARVAAGEALHGLLDTWRLRLAARRSIGDDDTPAVMIGHFTVRGSRVAGGEVMAGQEIEVSRNDLADLGADYVGLGHIHMAQDVGRPGRPVCYAGSLWRNTFAETEMKGWNLVEIDPDAETIVTRMDTYPRPRVTLDYRWASLEELDEPSWVAYPADFSGVDGAHVRARLVLPQQWASTVPWDEEIETLRELGAWKIKVQRVIEPVLRTRAPQVAEAETPGLKLQAYWGTLATDLDTTEKTAAREALTELQTDDDDTIQETTKRMMTQAAGPTPATNAETL